MLFVLVGVVPIVQFENENPVVDGIFSSTVELGTPVAADVITTLLATVGKAIGKTTAFAPPVEPTSVPHCIINPDGSF